MKKILMLIVSGVFVAVVAQAQDFSSAAGNGVPNGAKIQFKAEQLNTDKIETLTVTGTNGAVFTTSNTADGTSASFRHSLRIQLPLLTNAKGTNYQLVFYSEGENIPYAAATEPTVVSIYYPISVYESIRQKLEQAFSARKTVQLKVSQKTNGYREGSLVF